MAHHWRWHGSTRVLRWTRLTTTIGLLLACALAALPAVASANEPEVRGEWTLILKYSGNVINGTALVTEEANNQGEFAAHSVLLDGLVPGTFTGTLEGSTAIVETSSVPFGSLPSGKFNSSTMTVESTVSSLSMTGSGKFVIGGQEYSATLVATRVKSQKQIEEQEVQEKHEQEERAARVNVRGEWTITLEGAGKTLKGTALITEEANAKNMFASKSSQFEEGLINSTFTGTLKGNEAEVTVTTSEVPGTLPPGAFTGEKIAVSSNTNPTSMTGTGTFQFSGPSPISFPATITATRVRSHRQIEEQETQEREAKEKQEKEALEAEAKAKAEQEAKQKAEQEAKAKAEQEAAAKAAREAKEKQEKALLNNAPVILPLASVEPTTKTFTVTGGSLLLALENTNGYAVGGHLALSSTQAGKSSAVKHKSSKKTVSLGSASFSLSAHASSSVKVKLSSSALAELKRHKTLHAILTITTQFSGQPTTTKTFDVTLRASKSAHGKH